MLHIYVYSSSQTTIGVSVCSPLPDLLQLHNFSSVCMVHSVLPLELF